MERLNADGLTILLIDHVNRMRGVPGLPFDEAVIHGTLQRVRPILMTSATTVVGLGPLVLFSEADSNIWNALGFTLIGGLVSSTLLVLTVTPALYKLFERGGAPRFVLVPFVGFVEALMKAVLAGLAALFTFAGTDRDRLLWVAVVFAVTTYTGVHGTMTGPWTTSEVIDTTNGGASGQTVMSPSFLFNSGANFGAWLRTYLK